MTTTIALKPTLEAYLSSADFKSGVISSTKASWAGGSYKVELFADGTWRNLWSGEIGNRYESTGVVIALPTVDTEDMSEYVADGAGTEDDYLSEMFDLNEDELKAEMQVG